MTDQTPQDLGIDDADENSVLKKKALIEQVADATDMKKGDVKPVVEAMLAVLGENLAAGKVMNLQPFGKIQVLNEKDTDAARIIKCKVRQAKEPGKAHETITIETSDVPSPAVEAQKVVPVGSAPPRRKLSLSGGAS